MIATVWALAVGSAVSGAPASASPPAIKTSEHSAAFHAYPDEMRFDAISGDYGMGFFGHAYATASYLVQHPTFGWLGFGGVVSQSGGTVRIEPKDSGRSRLFVAPAGLWLTLQAGKIESSEYSAATSEVRLKLAPADAYTKAARLSVETTVSGDRMYAPQRFALERGLYTIPLERGATVVVLSPRSSELNRAR